MQGELAETTTLDLCMQLAAEGRTATVAVSSPRGEGVVVLVDGRLAGARAPTRDPMPAARLGERLVAAGRLSHTELAALLAEQATEPPAPALGHLLVERGMVPADVVRVALQEQVIDALEEMAGWFEGQWDVRPATPVDADVAVALPVDRVTVELRRRAAARDEAAMRELGLQPSGDPADRDSTGVPNEEPVLPASPMTGSRPVALADDGWADRRMDAATTVDEPEPWVGWANGKPRAPEPVAEEPVESAPTPTAAAWEPPAAPVAPSAAPADASPAESFSDPSSPAITPARPAADHDMRRALFSELHEVGRSHPTVAAPAPPPAPEPEVATPEPPVAQPVEEPAAPEPAPLSRADVSDLLAELHALNLDD